MTAPPFLRQHDPAIASQPTPALARAAVPAWCLAAAAAASAIAGAATRQAWVAAAVSGAGLAVCGWRVTVAFAALRAALDTARRERGLVEDALRRSQKMEALGRLAVGIAHDFNNHLTVISSNVELVKRRLDGGQDRLQHHADAAMLGVQRAATLTGRLLSYARQSAPEPEQVDVTRLLTQLGDLLRRTLGEGVTVTVRVTDETWYVWADATELENALLSLAVNVRDQVPDGAAVTLSVENTRLGEAWMASAPLVLPGAYVRIAVTASAAGGSADPQNWRPANELAGTDLSLARSFARDAGGYLLRADDASGAGLRLMLPRYQPSPPVPVQPKRAGGPVTVLVVEDNAAVRQACAEALLAAEYRVLQAPDAMEAFKLIADHGGIDLLLTDLGLPGGVSGKALADAARNVDRRMRVVFITGYDARDQSAPDKLTKPFSPAQLIDCVQRALGKKGLADGEAERLSA